MECVMFVVMTIHSAECLSICRVQRLRYKISFIAKFHYMGQNGPDQTKSTDFVGDRGI